MAQSPEMAQKLNFDNWDFCKPLTNGQIAYRFYYFVQSLACSKYSRIFIDSEWVAQKIIQQKNAPPSPLNEKIARIATVTTPSVACNLLTSVTH